MYFIILTQFIVNLLRTCYKAIIVQLAEHYSTCAIKFWLVPGFSPIKIGYSQNIFFNWNEKIEINFIILFLLSWKLKSISYIEISIAIKQKHKRFLKLPIALLVLHDVLKCFWTEIFSLIQQVRAILDFIFFSSSFNEPK